MEEHAAARLCRREQAPSTELRKLVAEVEAHPLHVQERVVEVVQQLLDSYRCVGWADRGW